MSKEIEEPIPRGSSSHLRGLAENTGLVNKGKSHVSLSKGFSGDNEKQTKEQRRRIAFPFTNAVYYHLMN